MDIAIAGGVESPVCEPSLAAWPTMRVMNVDTDLNTYGCCPFDENRNGLILGEGAAFYFGTAIDGNC
ncbi:beta-ketoacyl synthase N-terminal-like domain-containing protein [Vibrio coralliirubri]|uniref:beta-ketoacyl synthase N-terminal-like domain-containing protein n=1 Tax=Vibrio coralliirubri TaxID=1516159 RepID=UPI000D526474